LQYESQEGEPAIALRAHFVALDARCVYGANQVVGNLQGSPRWLPEVGRIIRCKIDLAEIAEDYACTEHLQFVMGVPACTQIFQFARIRPAIPTWRHVANLEFGIADRTVCLSHTSVFVAARRQSSGAGHSL
jgi:hypothetical protein